MSNLQRDPFRHALDLDIGDALPVMSVGICVMFITCVHQGFELYGSDRSFVECVSVMRRTYPDAHIEVVLPREGPIVGLLAGVCSRIVFEPIWVLRRKNLRWLMTLGLLSLPLAMWRAIRRFGQSDLVYINTSVIVDYAIVARWFSRKALLHIHEIPEGAALTLLRAMALWSRADIIFNSEATRRTFALPAKAQSQVIYNGVAGPALSEACGYDGTRPLRVAMLGRISRIKGQEILIDAVKMLPQEARERLQIRMVGSAFEDTGQQDALVARITNAGLVDCVVLEPFTTNTADIYQWADVVVVPSRLPESLGRVAIEAMSFERMVIASNIGGLSEVVDHATTGWLVPPGDVKALSDCLVCILERPSVLQGFGVAGRQRFETIFSEDIVSKIFARAISQKLVGQFHSSEHGIEETTHSKAVQC